MNLPIPSNKTLWAHRMTLVGYFGLVVLIPFWNLCWFPGDPRTDAIKTLAWLFPLALPLSGLLKGKAYTHAWSGFIAVLYICHGLTCLITHRAEIVPVLLEIILASLFLFSATYFAKWRGEQLGLQLPKK